MIPFNNLGHFFSGLGEPIVWLDSSDSNSYVLENPELVTNGDFSDGLNGWTTNANASASVVNGLVRVEVVASASGYLFQNVTGLQAGKIYNITANGYVGTSTKISLYTAKNGFNDLTNDGVINVNFTASDSDEVIRLYTYGNGTYGEWDNISVKEVLPNSQEVTSIDNLGTLGGQFDLLGNIKFANNGFEAWGGSDNISYDLLYPFLPDNSFTVALTINFTDNTTGENSLQQFPLSFYGNNVNYVNYYTNGATQFNQPFALSSNNSSFAFINPYTYGIMTFVFSYSLNNNKVVKLRSDGTYLINSPRTFNNTENAIIYLLNSYLSSRNLGKDNPLHEFRLYDKSANISQMLKIQTELNNKYI